MNAQHLPMSKRKLRAFIRNQDWDYRLVQVAIILILASVAITVLNYRQMMIIQQLIG